MTERPSLLDNRRPETEHGEGLAYLARDLPKVHGLSVATGYLNLGGLRHLAHAVSADRHTRLLVGAAPEAGLGEGVPVALFERTLAALRGERDLARFPPSRELSELLEVRDWLARGDVEVRRFTSTFLHGKAYLFGHRGDARLADETRAARNMVSVRRDRRFIEKHYPGASMPGAAKARSWRAKAMTRW